MIRYIKSMSYSVDPIAVARNIEEVLVDAETGRWDISAMSMDTLYDAASILYELSRYDGTYNNVAANKKLD